MGMTQNGGMRLLSTIELLIWFDYRDERYKMYLIECSIIFNLKIVWMDQKEVVKCTIGTTLNTTDNAKPTFIQKWLCACSGAVCCEM